MTVMDKETPDIQVTVRDLQRNASAVLHRIEEGESIAITRHGKVIARLLPPDPAERAVSSAVDAGILDPAALSRARTAAETARSARRPAAEEGEPVLGQVLADLREEEGER